MPQKKKNNLGRSLVKDRFKGYRTYRSESERHTAELGDGYDWNRINLRSVTEESSLEEFLSTAQLAGTEFTAEKLNAKFVNNHGEIGMLDEAERKRVLALHKQHSDSLRIPRRPPWTEQMTAQQLRVAEETEFLNWRRQMSLLQQENNLLLTPYERNLEFWRQLWRVVERSDVMVQLLDARNPLLYRCSDLERYVLEQNRHRRCLLLLNKADLLTARQRARWAAYFRRRGVLVAFFSALEHAPGATSSGSGENQREQYSEGGREGLESVVEEEDEEEEEELDEVQRRNDDIAGETTYNLKSEVSSVNDVSNSIDTLYISSDPTKNSSSDNNYPSNNSEAPNIASNCSVNTADCSDTSPDPANLISSSSNTEANPRAHSVGDEDNADGCLQDDETGRKPVEETLPQVLEQLDADDGSLTANNADDSSLTADDIETSALLSVAQLIALLKSLCSRVRQLQQLPPGRATVGFVGYPNVGKSSTMNALLGSKLTSVSATPGKTKHFQTHHWDSDLVLCDCPGLVMPSFVSTRAEMVVWGVLPIDQMRDHVGPANHVAHLIPRHVLEGTYGFTLPDPREGEQKDRPPTADELLNAHGLMRGFMTKHGVPDNSRSARILLKDFVSGRLLYCVAPPDCDQQQFHSWPVVAPRSQQQPQFVVTSNLPTSAAIDRSFFSSCDSQSHSRDHRGTVRTNGRVRVNSANSEKPWRVKEARRTCKREKLRRVYRHLDE